MNLKRRAAAAAAVLAVAAAGLLAVQATAEATQPKAAHGRSLTCPDLTASQGWYGENRARLQHTRAESVVGSAGLMYGALTCVPDTLWR
ncbi:hypothetical protein [Streptomyces sp. DSM 118878]